VVYNSQNRAEKKNLKLEITEIWHIYHTNHHMSSQCQIQTQAGEQKQGLCAFAVSDFPVIYNIAEGCVLDIKITWFGIAHYILNVLPSGNWSYIIEGDSNARLNGVVVIVFLLT